VRRYILAKIDAKLKRHLLLIKSVSYRCFENLPLPEMRVLGIDPGSETLGWGVVDGIGSKYKLVGFGTVQSNRRHQFSKRLLNIYNGVAELMAEHSPDVLSVEDTFYAVNVGVALKLGQVRGTMLLLAEQRGMEIAEYAPRLVKQTVVGYGNAEKHQVQQMVKVLLGMQTVPTPHDAADALAIAICHFHHAGLRQRLEKTKGRI
jgi:crossover junction endodeoxyribonuclease RuvC